MVFAVKNQTNNKKQTTTLLYLLFQSESPYIQDTSSRRFPANLTLLPWGGVGGRRCFGPRHHTGSQKSRTLSLGVSKISDFSCMPFGHIVAKCQVS